MILPGMRHGINHNAVMTSLNIAKAGDASNEFLEYLQEQEFIDSILEA